MADDSLEIKITANTSDAQSGIGQAENKIAELTAKLEVAKRVAGEYGTALKKGAEAALASGKTISEAAQGLTDVAEGAVSARREVRSIEQALERAGDVAVNFGQVGRHAIAIFDESMRGQRGAMISSISSMIRDSGALGVAVEALSGPFGIATAGAVALAAALADTAYRANQAERALQGVYNAAFASGRAPAAAEAHFGELQKIIAPGGGDISRRAATPISAAIEAIPGASEKAKTALAGIADAWRQIQFGGDTKKTAEAISKIFESPQSLRTLVEKNRLLSGQQLEQFLSAVSSHNLPQASELAIHGLTERYGPAAKELTARRDEFMAELKNSSSLYGPPGPQPTGSRLRLPAPLTMPSEAEIQANQFIAEGNKLADERAEKLREIEAIKKAIAAGEVADDERSRAAIQRLQQQADQLGRRADKNPSHLKDLDAELARQNAAIAERFAAGGENAGKEAGAGIADGMKTSFSKQADSVVGSMMQSVGHKFHNACAELVNNALKEAGLPTSGSNLASSFKNFGQRVAPNAVRRGDVFYAPPSGMGDTGHVGVTLGQVENGRVRVVSSHMQGAASNPAGIEYRSVANLQFRRPAYSDTGSADMGSAGRPHSAEAARLAELQNSVAFYQRVKNSGYKVGGTTLSNSDKEEVDRKLAEKQQQLAQATMQANDRAARESATVALDSARRQTDAAERGSQQRIAAAQHEVAVATQVYGAGSREVIDAQYRLSQAERDSAQAGVRDRLSTIQEEIAASRTRLQAVHASLAEEVADHQKTAVEAAQIYQDEVNKEIEIRRNALAEEESIDGLSREQRRTLERQKTQIAAEGERERAEAARAAARAVEQENRKFTADLKHSFDGMGSSIEQAFNGLVTGQVTGAQALQRVWQGVTSSILTGLEGIASKAAAGLLGAKGGEGLGDFLGNAASNYIGKQLSGLLGNALPSLAGSATTAAGAAATTAAVTAGSATITSAIIASTTANSTAIATSTGSIVGAIYSSTAVTAAVPKPFGFAGGGIVPAAAGGWALPSSFGTDRVMAALTPGEMVLPTHLSSGIQSMIEGGGSGGGQMNAEFHLHVNGPADGPSIERWFDAKMASRLPTILRRAYASNRLTPRTT